MINVIKENSTKILFTLFIMVVYLIGSAITIPYIDTSLLEAVMGNNLFSMISMLSGGSLQQFSIFALGVGPYITASIVIQLLSMDVIPYLTEQRELGKRGQQNIDKITRYVGVVMAYVQSITLLMTLNGGNGVMTEQSIWNILLVSTIMVAGMMALLWMGDMITEKGIGNGVTLIIFTGIVANLPQTFINLFTSLNYGIGGYIQFGLFVAMYLVIIIGVIFINNSERRIPIQTNGVKASKNTHLPLKINSASVIPVIFSQTIIYAPLTVLSFINSDLYTKLSGVLSFSQPYMLIIYALLIIGFTYMYTQLQMNPEDIADNLKQQGAYIVGVRPGKDTERYLKSVINKITVLGAISLMIIALLPYILPMITDIPSSSSIGGTGIIIVVGAAVETIKQLQNTAYKNKYKAFKMY